MPEQDPNTNSIAKSGSGGQPTGKSYSFHLAVSDIHDQEIRKL